MSGDDLKWMGELTVMSDARYFQTLSGKKVGESSDFGATRVVNSTFDPTDPVFPVSVSLGRTVSLGNYEFARISVGVDVIGRVKARQELYEWGIAWCTEMLERELASIHSKDRDKNDLPPPPDSVVMVVPKLDYGLTIALAKFNSAKVDVGYSLPTDPDSLEAAWVEMQTFVGDRVSQQVSVLRGGKVVNKDMGI